MAKISRLSKIDKPCVYIYAGVALDARIPEVQPVFRAATRSPADRTPKFGTARFLVNSSASFSSETVAFRRRPPPPRGSSRRSLHRSGLMFLNTSPFDCFPFVFVFPAVFPASSSMAGPLFFVSGHPTASSGARTSRHRRPACPRGRARCVPGPAAFHALHSRRRRRPVRARPCRPCAGQPRCCPVACVAGCHPRGHVPPLACQVHLSSALSVRAMQQEIPRWTCSVREQPKVEDDLIYDFAILLLFPAV